MKIVLCMPRISANKGQYKIEGRTAIVKGVEGLGAHVKASDLRAGAALLIAGLMAEGLPVLPIATILIRAMKE